MIHAMLYFHQLVTKEHAWYLWRGTENFYAGLVDPIILILTILFENILIGVGVPITKYFFQFISSIYIGGAYLIHLPYIYGFDP